MNRPDDCECSRVISMQWFFALTEDSTAFRQYAEMIMVAVRPGNLPRSSRTAFTMAAIMISRVVNQTRRADHSAPQFSPRALTELGRRKGNPHLAPALSGAFSRVELPEIVARLGGAPAFSIRTAM